MGQLRIQYTVGNQTFTLHSLHVNDIGIEAVYSEDRTTFHYERVVVDVIAHLNPAMNAIVFPPTLTGRPGGTHAALRHALMQKRGRLRVEMDDGTVLIDCPKPPFQTDAHNGPTPIHFDILEMTGSEDLTVHYVIEACVNECSSKHLVLSHRWRMAEDVDRDSFSTRIIEGQVVYRTDVMFAAGLGPDSLRSFFFHPKPDGMRRTINVWTTEDGSELRYRLTDRVESHHLTGEAAQVASWIEVDQVERRSRPDPYDVGYGKWANDLGGQLFSLGRLLRRAMGGGGLTFRGFSITEGLIAGRGALSPLSLPQTFSEISVKVWGTPYSRRDSLARLAISIGLTRMFATFGVVPGGSTTIGDLPGTREWTLHQKLTGKYAEFHIVVRLGQNDKTIAHAITLPQNAIPPDEKLKAFGQVAVTDDPVKGPEHPNDSGARGSWIGQLTAQWLQGPCQATIAPINYFSPVLKSAFYPFASSSPGVSVASLQNTPPTSLSTGGTSTLSSSAGGITDPGPLPS